MPERILWTGTASQSFSTPARIQHVGIPNPHTAIAQMVRDVRTAIAAEAWHAALALALTLPDVCGKLDSPKTKKAQDRYAIWFDRYLAPHYLTTGEPKHAMMTASDCFAIRCAVLHEGSDDLGRQDPAATLTRFVFAAPSPGAGSVHCNTIYGTLGISLLVQVDEFCEDICAAVEKWMADPDSAFKVSAAMGRALLTVHPHEHAWQAIAGKRRLF